MIGKVLMLQMRIPVASMMTPSAGREIGPHERGHHGGDQEGAQQKRHLDKKLWDCNQSDGDTQFGGEYSCGDEIQDRLGDEDGRIAGDAFLQRAKYTHCTDREQGENGGELDREGFCLRVIGREGQPVLNPRPQQPEPSPSTRRSRPSNSPRMLPASTAMAIAGNECTRKNRYAPMLMAIAPQYSGMRSRTRACRNPAAGAQRQSRRQGSTPRCLPGVLSSGSPPTDTSPLGVSGFIELIRTC